ncbi:MAG: glycoside hydrolase family 26 protein [Caulobacteraceae bacterium]
MRASVCLLLATAALSAFAATAQAAPLVYVYKGSGCTGVAALPAFRNLLSRQEDGVVDFGTYGTGTSMASATSEASWALGCWQGKVKNIAYSVGMAFSDATTAQIGTGKADAFFTAMGASLVSHGFPNAYVRLGWEMNGSWYPWGGLGATYVTAFNKAAVDLKKGCPNCKIIWNPVSGGNAPSSEFPGVSNIDVIGDDEYASSWNSGGVTVEPGLFGTATTGDYGGAWGFISYRPGSRAFYVGTATGQKPYAIPEMGVGSRSDGHGACTSTTATGCDDGVFMADELASATAAQFIGFWDYNAGDYNSQFSDASRPTEALAFLQAEGSSYLQAYLKGAKVYTGTFKATASGLNSFLVQLASGSLAIIFWGDSTNTTTTTITLSQPRALGAFRPADGSVAYWDRASSLKYGYTSNLSIVTISAS